MPLPLAGPGVQRDQTLGEQVVAAPVAAVPVVRRRRHRQVDEAELVVAAHHRPHVRVPGVLPGAVEPRLVAELAGLRNRVEDPAHLAGAHVVAADVAGRHLRSPRTVRDDRAEHDDVGADDRRRRVGVLALVDLAAQADGGVHHAAVAEGRVGLARRPVERDQAAVVRRVDQALGGFAVDLPAPVLEPALLETSIRRTAGVVAPRVGDPKRLACTRVDRRHLAERGRDVERAVDVEGRALVHAAAKLRVGLRLDRCPAPDFAQPVDVGRVDLIERRVLGRGAVGGVVMPLADRRRGRCVGVKSTAAAAGRSEERQEEHCRKPKRAEAGCRRGRRRTQCADTMPQANGRRGLRGTQ